MVLVEITLQVGDLPLGAVTLYEGVFTVDVVTGDIYRGYLQEVGWQ